MSFQYNETAQLGQSGLLGTLGCQAIDAASPPNVVLAFSKQHIAVAANGVDYRIGPVSLPDTALWVQIGLESAPGSGVMGTVLIDDPVESPALSTLTAQAVVDYMDANSTRLADIQAHTDLITPGAITVTSPVVVEGDTISTQRGDTWVIPFVNLGSLAAIDKLWFTVKRRYSDADSAALVMIELAAGLLVINGAVATSPAHASITITNSNLGTGHVTVKGAETARLPILDGCKYDFQKLVGSDDPTTLSHGTFNITGDVTRATS